VLGLMAEGLSNAAIAARPFLSEGAISKYTTTIFAKLALADDQDTNRRVRRSWPTSAPTDSRTNPGFGHPGDRPADSGRTSVINGGTRPIP
jgi:hypothetical protein